MADVGVSVWEDPPSRSRGPGGGQWQPFVEELRMNPGEWGRLNTVFEDSKKAQTVAANLRGASKHGRYGDGAWQFVSRTIEEDDGEKRSYVYGRYDAQVQ